MGGSGWCVNDRCRRMTSMRCRLHMMSMRWTLVDMRWPRTMSDNRRLSKQSRQKTSMRCGNVCCMIARLAVIKTRDALVGFDNVLAVAVLDGLTARWQLAIMAGCEDLFGGGCEGGSSTIAACACWLRVTPCRSIAHFQLNPRTQGHVVVPRWHACRKTTVDDRWRRRHWACLEPGWQAVVMPGCKHTTSSMNGVQRR